MVVATTRMADVALSYGDGIPERPSTMPGAPADDCSSEVPVSAGPAEPANSADVPVVEARRRNMDSDSGGGGDRDSRQGSGHCASQELDKDAAKKTHIEQVAQMVRHSQGSQDKLASWFGSRLVSPADTTQHVDVVFSSSGIMDTARRAELVRESILRLQQAQVEKKHKKKMREKLRDAAGLPKLEEGPEASAWADACKEAGGASPRNGGCSQTAGPADVEQPTEGGWSKVGEFATLPEALRFVMECQPFDFRPLRCFWGEESFPAFDNTREAYQHVMQMEPVPTEFISVERDFCRRLRIRKRVDSDVTDGKARSSLAAMRKRKSLGFSKNAKGAKLVESVLAAAELNAWIVEAAGSLFERPQSLRHLNNHAANARFFIAVSPDIEKKILTEGFRVQRRCSIPCSATPKDAREAFRRRESGERQDGSRGRPTSPRVSVLSVAIPPELGIDVVAHKSGGFLIRATELPASCFSRLKRTVEAG
mmetsp:Transcript_12060/g.34478  ORF Transcript_12060/g.34478 Transcript_12060/m.34478 type:complete len:481 (-) Transcript_12060:426-1868(-)